MSKVILTAPVPRTTQKKVKELAKANNVPIRVLCSMLIEQGLEDIKTGKLAITKPTVTASTRKNKPAA